MYNTEHRGMPLALVCTILDGDYCLTHQCGADNSCHQPGCPHCVPNNEAEPNDLTLGQLQAEAHRIAVAHGWWSEERNVGELLMLIVTEVAEAMEEWRHGHDLSQTYYVEGKPEGVPSELADVMIRVADLAAHFGISLETVVQEKLHYNESRPYRHGGKRA